MAFLDRISRASSILAIAILLSPHSTFAESRVIINTGSAEPYLFLERIGHGEGFVGGDKDGVISIWERPGESPHYRYRLSYHPLLMAVIHPEKTELAVVTKNDRDNFSLISWNWVRGEQLWSIELHELPLFLNYSPSGDVLVCGVADWDSLSFLDSSTGEFLPYLQEGFGIVADALISSSGKTVLSYGPSGSIQYRSIPGGGLKQRLPTEIDLLHTEFTSTGRNMVASSGEELLSIDLISGKVEDRVVLPGIQEVVIAPIGDMVITCSISGMGYKISAIPLVDGQFGPPREFGNLTFSGVEALTALDGVVLIAHSSGEISSLDLYSGVRATIDSPRLLEIDDLAANDTKLLLSTEDQLFSIPTDNLTELLHGDKRRLMLVRENSPTRGRLGVVPYGSTDFLLYTLQSTPGKMVIYSSTGEVLREFDHFPNSFGAVDLYGNKVASLDSRGDIRLTDLTTGEDVINYPAVGVRSISLVDESTIVLAGGTMVNTGTPLLKLNAFTGETVPIEDSRVFVFQVRYDPISQRLYSVGIGRQRELSRTIVKTHHGKLFARSSTLFTIPGEHLLSHLLVETRFDKLFTSHRSGGISMMYWDGVTPFERSPNLPGKLITPDGRTLLSLNSNGTLGGWSIESGEHLYTIYIFKDGNWIILFSDGRFQASKGGEVYIDIYK